MTTTTWITVNSTTRIHTRELVSKIIDKKNGCINCEQKNSVQCLSSLSNATSQSFDVLRDKNLTDTKAMNEKVGLRKLRLTSRLIVKNI